MSLSWSGLRRLDPLDLRDDLVAAAGDVEAVDVVAADHGAQIGADLSEVEAQGGHLVAVDDELGLGLVDLDVDQRREGEHAAVAWPSAAICWANSRICGVSAVEARMNSTGN